MRLSRRIRETSHTMDTRVRDANEIDGCTDKTDDLMRCTKFLKTV